MLICKFNYQDSSVITDELTVTSDAEISNFDYRVELVGSSAAPYQIPRLTATITLVYNSQDPNGDVAYFFRQTAKKGMLVCLIETNAAPDPRFPDTNYPIDKKFLFILESFSFREDEQEIVVVLTNQDFASGEIVQYGGKLTPIDFAEETINQYGLKNVTRLPLNIDGVQRMICISNPTEALQALAWCFDGKRHNIGFAPALGVSQTGKVVLIPQPSQAQNGIPRYQIEPEYIINKTTTEPEVIVTELNTGVLQGGNLVPIVSPISALTSISRPLARAVKTFYDKGKLVAWAINSGLTENYYYKDALYLGEQLVLFHYYSEKIIGVAQGRYNNKDGWFIIRNGRPEFYDVNGNFIGYISVSGPELEMSSNFNQYEANRGSYEGIIINTTTNATLYLPPMIGTQQSYSDSAPLAIVKTGSAFKTVAVDDYDQEYWGMYPIKAYAYDDIGLSERTTHILAVSSGYSLAAGKIFIVDQDGNFSAVRDISGVQLPAGTNNDWSTAKYIDWNNRKDSYVGAYCVYTIPSATAGKTFVVFQLLQTQSSNNTSVADTKYYIEVTDLVGVHISDRDDPLIIVTKNGWTSYNTRSASGNWFTQISSGSNERWQNISEMYNGKSNYFVMSEEVSTTSTELTRAVYIMEGTDPFGLYSLSDRKVSNKLVPEVNPNARDITYVIDLPSLSYGSKIPLLGKKVELEISNIKWKVNSTDQWTVEDVTTLATPLLGTLCRYRLTPDDTEYTVGIISKVHMWWDGLTRLTVTVVASAKENELIAN